MKSTFLDRAISLISPGAGLSRMRARVATKQLESAAKVRRYEGASAGRRTEGWRTTSGGANAEIRQGAKLLRDRSRDLIRNNPYAKRAVQIIGTNVVGSGIRAAATGAPNKKALRKINAVWGGWADFAHCDFDGQHNFYGLQRAAIRAVAESGEVLIVRKRLTPQETARYGGVGIQLQVLEGDFLDSGKDGLLTNGTGRIIQGVEFNAYGRRAAYWLFTAHPGETYGYGAATSVRVPAEDVLHIYEVLRPGQVRGVPFGVSAILRLRDLDEYEDAQLVRQKIAACFSVFYYGTETSGGDLSETEDNQSDIPDRVEPGMIEKLPAGSSVEMASPPKADGYGEYLKTSLQGVAAGYGVTYEQLTGDLSNVNFTSARMGRLEFEAYVSELQETLLIVQLGNKVWEWFTASAWANGAIPNATAGVKWTSPARKMVDPVKEIKAFRDAVRSGFMSYSDAVLALGSNPDELREAIVADNAEADALKLEFTSDPRKYGDNGTPVQNNPMAVA